MNQWLEFFVDGQAIPQGSKKGYYRGGRCVLVDVNRAALMNYRERVKVAAERAVKNFEGEYNKTKGFDVVIQIDMKRPPSHFKKKGGLTKAAPLEPYIKKADIDKVYRAVLDGLTGVVFNDDCQVISLSGDKRYSTYEGTLIRVTRRHYGD